MVAVNFQFSLWLLLNFNCQEAGCDTLRWRYTVDVPILTCPINFVLTYNVLVSEVNNEIRNLLHFSYYYGVAVA